MNGRHRRRRLHVESELVVATAGPVPLGVTLLALSRQSHLAEPAKFAVDAQGLGCAIAEFPRIAPLDACATACDTVSAMQGKRSIKQRPFLWMLVLALVVLAAISIVRVLGLRGELEAEMSTQMQTQLRDMVTTWETQVVEKTNSR